MRSATLFLIAILTPCAVLAWVSWRSMREEATNIRQRQTAFYQQSADNAARTAEEFMTGELHRFAEAVDKLLAGAPPADLQRRFHVSLRSVFPAAEAGLAFETESARLLAQAEPSGQAVTAFASQHADFFSPEPQELFIKIPDGDAVSLIRRAARETAAAPETPALNAALDELAKDAGPPAAVPAPNVEPAAPRPPGAPPPGEPPAPRPLTTTLGRLLSKYDSGIAGRLQGEALFTLLWYRPPDLPEVTFAAALDRRALQDALAKHAPFTAPDGDTCLALLDHRRQPAAQWTRGSAFAPESWRAPLVTRSIGAALPRWEAAVFLRDPDVFRHLASAARWRLGLIVTTASLVALGGAYFILRDARRAARDARLKTDFVSNVSHELKTPLTSIRMFSDLLGNQPAAPPEKTKRYAEVIAGEAARLTRLINNVLNFSRMESGREHLQPAPVDLCALTAETVEHMRPQLEKDGFRLDVHLPDAPVTLTADADALSQVLLNLLTNAGKYGGAEDRREITVALHNGDGRVRLSVADRGPGVPRGHERRIFEKFQRAHNTLASGTAGSGLGLTIARRLVEAHGGTLEYTARDGGGAEFTVTLDAA